MASASISSGSRSITSSRTDFFPPGFPVPAAMAARTRHVQFSRDVCLLPFNHPIRLAEDLAVLDSLTDIVSWAVPPACLEGFARDVAPRLRARFNGK